ncbi:potassium channel family protein [Nonomuraea sp. NPDC059194]|uniref:potassium channel family protein n=1 Tax=Nonomuraea sp. NPDC059194 TaxID=3346764 RepID=UPI0036B5262B
MPPSFWSTLRSAALIVALYYLLPVEERVPGWLTWVRLGGFVLGTALLVWGVVLAARQQEEEVDHGRLPLRGLLLLTLTGVVLFALADFAVATSMDGQFVGLKTKTDALYFAVSTLATVGYGDVHASGQLARGLVLVQMAFNLVVLASAVSLMSVRFKAKVRSRHEKPHH